MSVYAHKDDKGKFNLGNESDLTGIGDGTPFGAIKELNNDLTDIRRNGIMPDLDYGNPLYTFDSTHTNYTATKTCYMFGNAIFVSGYPNLTVKINNTTVLDGSGGDGNIYVLPFIKLKAGDTVNMTLAGTTSINIKVYDTI